jgi:hypothetical protein
MSPCKKDPKFGRSPRGRAESLMGQGRQTTASDATGRRPSWPTLDVGGVPEDDVAVTLAERVRSAVLGETYAPLLDLQPLTRRGRFRVSVERLSAADGGMEACLTPDADDSFDIVVDPEPPGGWRPHHDGLREDIRRHRWRFRIGHEVAHSFFFDRVSGQLPRRRVPDSPEQERFCDVFAGALLLPPRVVARTEPTPENIMGLQRGYDVSLHLAVRTFSDTHPTHAFVLLYTDEERPYLRPQWMSRASSWLPRWWAGEPVQRLGRRPVQTVVVPRKDGGRSRLRALWIPERRQALFVGR